MNCRFCETTRLLLSILSLVAIVGIIGFDLMGWL
tara:strand:+ start:205 stop:306 length:102 start_codon:yes stop_codon:yes gene_type:complete